MLGESSVGCELLVVLGRKARDCDRRNLASVRIVPDGMKQLVAVHVRERNVEQQHVGAPRRVVVAEDIENALSRSRRANVGTLLSHGQGHKLCIVLVVVGNQDESVFKWSSHVRVRRCGKERPQPGPAESRVSSDDYAEVPLRDSIRVLRSGTGKPLFLADRSGGIGRSVGRRDSR